MSACEKCWSDAFGSAARYKELLDQRIERPCTPEEQAGPGATVCPKCGKRAVHQYAKDCMACDYRAPVAGGGR